MNEQRKRRKQNTMGGVGIAIYFRPENEQFIREQAEKRGISLAWVVNEALTEYRQRVEALERDHEIA